MTGPERHEAEQDMGGLAGLAGMEAVREQLASAIAIIRAEQARRDAGMMVARPAWKNLVFTGGLGSGKSRAAAAVGRLYRQLGVLPAGHLAEVASADLAGATSQQTAQLVREAAGRGRGGILMITGAHAWAGLADRDQQVLRCLQQALTDFRGDLVVILAGQASGLRALLRARPALAARFPVIIDFRGYTAGHLAAIFATLAGEAGFTLTPAAVRKASVALGRAGRDPADGSARLAVWLLDQATARQARRITTAPQPLEPAALCTIHAADIPDQVHLRDLPGLARADDDSWPGQYLELPRRAACCYRR